MVLEGEEDCVPRLDFCDVVLLSKVHPILQALGLEKKSGKRFEAENKAGKKWTLASSTSVGVLSRITVWVFSLPIRSGGFRAWLDANINTSNKMAGANVLAGPHPFHRAPFGAGRQPKLVVTERRQQFRS
eukprot:4240136-Amphidinium_carterae.1